MVQRVLAVVRTMWIAHNAVNVAVAGLVTKPLGEQTAPWWLVLPIGLVIGLIWGALSWRVIMALVNAEIRDFQAEIASKKK